MASNTIRIGNVEITAVADASGLSGPIQMLFPQVAADAWAPFSAYLTDDGKSLSMSITTYLVRSAGKTILVDTGVGAKNRPFMPQGRLPDALAEVGVALDAIDIVANTHMHVDHVGWHTTQDGEAYVPTFPRAKHLFNRTEWEYFTSAEIAPTQPHIVDCILPIRDHVDITLTDAEYAITHEVTLLPAPGHTPAHQVFVIRSAADAGVIWGDLCHHPAQVTELWSPMFDMNPDQARASRDAVLQRIEDESLRVVAGHFPYPGFGAVERVDGKRYWRPAL